MGAPGLVAASATVSGSTWPACAPSVCAISSRATSSARAIVPPLPELPLPELLLPVLPVPWLGLLPLLLEFAPLLPLPLKQLFRCYTSYLSRHCLGCCCPCLSRCLTHHCTVRERTRRPPARRVLACACMLRRLLAKYSRSTGESCVHTRAHMHAFSGPTCM